MIEQDSDESIPSDESSITMRRATVSLKMKDND